MVVMTPPRPRGDRSADESAKKPKRRGVPLHIWIEPALKDAIDRLSDQNRRPLTTEVVIALEKHLKEAGLWPPAGP